MPRLLTRIVAFLLVPCLLADPTLALALQPNSGLAIAPHSASALYQEQALIPAIAVAAFVGVGLVNSEAFVRMYHSLLHSPYGVYLALAIGMAAMRQRPTHKGRKVMTEDIPPFVTDDSQQESRFLIGAVLNAMGHDAKDSAAANQLHVAPAKSTHDELARHSTTQAQFDRILTLWEAFMTEEDSLKHLIGGIEALQRDNTDAAKDIRLDLRFRFIQWMTLASLRQTNHGAQSWRLRPATPLSDRLFRRLDALKLNRSDAIGDGLYAYLAYTLESLEDDEAQGLLEALEETDDARPLNVQESIHLLNNTGTAHELHPYRGGSLLRFFWQYQHGRPNFKTAASTWITWFLFPGKVIRAVLPANDELSLAAVMHLSDEPRKIAHLKAREELAEAFKLTKDEEDALKTLSPLNLTQSMPWLSSETRTPKIRAEPRPFKDTLFSMALPFALIAGGAAALAWIYATGIRHPVAGPSGIPVVHAELGWYTLLTFLRAPWTERSSGGFKPGPFENAGTFNEAQGRISSRYNVTGNAVEEFLLELQSFLDAEKDVALRLEITNYHSEIRELSDEAFFEKANQLAQLDKPNFLDAQEDEPAIRSMEEWIKSDYRILDTPRRLTTAIIGHALYIKFPDYDPDKELYRAELALAYKKARIVMDLVRRWQERDLKHQEFVLPTTPSTRWKAFEDFIREIIFDRLRSIFDGLRSYKEIFSEAAAAFKKVSGRELIDLPEYMQTHVDTTHREKAQTYEGLLQRMSERKLEAEYYRIAPLAPAHYTSPANIRHSFKNWLHNPYYVIDASQKVVLRISQLQGLMKDERFPKEEIEGYQKDLDKAYMEGVYLVHIFTRWQKRSDFVAAMGARGLLWSNDMIKIKQRLPGAIGPKIIRHPSRAILLVEVVFSFIESFLHASRLPGLAFQIRQLTRWLFAYSLGRAVVRQHSYLPRRYGLSVNRTAIAITRYLLDDEGRFASDIQSEKIYRTLRETLFEKLVEPSKLPAREKLSSYQKEEKSSGPSIPRLLLLPLGLLGIGPLLDYFSGFGGQAEGLSSVVMGLTGSSLWVAFALSGLLTLLIRRVFPRVDASLRTFLTAA